MQQALVLRDGQRIEMVAEKLVTGDIVYIKGGDKIPADLRFLESHGCKVRNREICTMLPAVLQEKACTK